MKFKRIITLLVLGSVGLILLVLAWVSLLSYHRSRIASAIIGKADGPESIVVANGNSCVILCVSAIIVIGLTIILLAIFRRKK